MELKTSRKVAYALLTTVAMLGALEIALRFVLREVGHASIPAPTVEAHVKGGMAYDPDLGWTWPRLPEPEVGINKDGFRHTDIAREKPADTWRAFTLGDSQTYGAGVDRDQTYSAVAERELQKTPRRHRRVELVDAGISGYSSLQALRLIEKKLLKWHPDVLIIDCQIADSPRDMGAPNASGAVASIQRVLFYSRVYYLMHFLIDRLQPHHAPRMKADRKMDASLLRDFGNHDRILELGQRYGIPVVFEDYPFWDTPKDAVTCLVKRELLPKGGIVAPVCEALQRSGHAGHELFLDNNHPTVLGHQLIGEALARALVEAGVGP